jgi:hypothetical protein
MPARDRTGPMGMGPKTGGGRGWCNPCIAGWRTPMGYPYFPKNAGWGRIPYGTGMLPMNPAFGRFRPFSYRPFGRGRGLRRRWW